MRGITAIIFCTHYKVSITTTIAMIHILKVSFFCLPFLFGSLPVSGQQGRVFDAVSISSPNAASLGKYADIPVDYNTGLPQISIPVYEIKSGPLKLPISLSYHASGLKVQENASWVGAGWSLNAGGAITRTVRGLPDDGSMVTSQQKAHYIHYGFNSYPGFPETTDPSFVDALDGEPDLFFFNFNGISGKFFFNDDRTPVLVPEQDLKIEVGLAGDTFERFTITSPDGTKYYFGKNESNVAIEVTTTISSQFGQVSGQPVSSWFLNKIESADGVNTIQLNYEEEKYSYYTFSTSKIDGYSRYPYSSTYPSSSYDAYLVKNNVKGVRLNQIVFSNGIVNFIPDNSNREDLARYDFNDLIEYPNVEAKALKEIQISNVGNTFCKKFSFDYSYWVDNTTVAPVVTRSGVSVSSDTKRLKLESIEELVCGQTTNPAVYSFAYYGEKVPRKLSFGMDYWGFYNGSDNNHTIIPTYYENLTKVPGGERAPKWPEMRGGTLWKITYPTGGYTKFDYEPHDTYVNYTILEETSSQYIHLGGDGNANRSVPDDLTVTITEGGCYVNMKNNSPNWNASLRFFDENNIYKGGLNVAIGESKEETISLPNGTLTVRLTFDNVGPLDQNPSGYPAEAYIKTIKSTGVNKNEMVGGLRIQKTTSTPDLYNSPVTATFAYTGNGTNSSGELYNRPTFVQGFRNDGWRQLKGNGPFENSPPACSQNGCSVCDPPASISFPYVKSGGDLRPMAAIQGNHMGYTKVVVRQNKNGSKTYGYFGSKFLKYPYLLTPPGAVAVLQINTTVCELSIPHYPTAPTPFEFLRGQLAYELYSSETAPVMSKYYNYEYKENPLTTPGLIIVTHPMLWGTEYELNTARKELTEVTEVHYSPDGDLTTKQFNYYESKYHNGVTKSISINSEGQSLITKHKYTFDYPVPQCDLLDDGTTTYLNAVASAKQTFELALLEADVYQTQTRYTAYQQFRKSKQLARVALINTRKLNLYGIGSEYTSLHNNAKSVASANLKPILQMQDNFQNPVIESASWIDGALVSSQYAGYEMSGTVVSPAIIELIQLDKPGATLNSSEMDGSNIVKDNRYRIEEHVKLVNGNILEQQKTNDVKQSYIWGYNSQYPIASVTNGSVKDIFHTSFEETEGNSADGDAKTGKRSKTGGYVKNLTNLTAGRYVLSYWQKSGSNWSYVEDNNVVISGTSYQVNISNNLQVDEVRFYPFTAQMTTYTYDPLKGITSQCDVDNHITYYEYDGFGRLVVVRDQDRNITKHICYNYAGQEDVCSY